MTVFDELKARGLLAQLTDEEEIKELVNNGKAVFYIGFDPTADSLHVGHFMALCLMKRLQMAGNKPIALIGGGTAMIGDPSGRTDMRNMMTTETIDHNCECFKKQMSRFIDFGENAGAEGGFSAGAQAGEKHSTAIMVNNADWLRDLNYIEFIRDIGAHFSVNRMLTAECYKQRMEKGLSFLEFNYMIMQSYDFLCLYEKYGCNMQFGGDDQWSNMLGGTELIRRKLGKDAYAMTITLLLNSEGKKMGKTQKGAVWLDPEKTSPYEFYQYWRNVADADVLKCLRMLTFLPLEQIDEMDKWEGSQLNQAKEILAFELTKMIHGEEEATRAQESARALFTGGNAAEMPTYELQDSDFLNGSIDILGVLASSGLTASRSEARRAVEQGGVTVDGEKVTDTKTAYTPDQFAGEGIIVKRGKKNFRRILMK
ncbi:MAG: tyrosine--tRNA ligase [Acetatifactor sp.]|nr:tyrosine--tRNA ligase [Acetatifactor sp.]